MKTAGMLLNFKNDSCQILGRYLKLQRTTSGHNNLPLTFGNLKIVLYCETLENVVERRRSYWQFAHASKEKLISLVRCSRVFHDKEFLDQRRLQF